MKIAVMQPYLFPYVGYFQMINAVDKFVFYDDVNFIKQGWINRNKILLNNKEFLFTVPLKKANSFCLIKDTLINKNFYERWKTKFQLTINQNYQKAPNYTEVDKLINNILNKRYNTISELAIESVITISKYLGLKTEFFISSKRYENIDLEREDRLVDICKKENATNYVNALGGQELYNKESFKEKGIELSFIKSLTIEYKQFNNEFVPFLSIIDLLMFNSVEEVKKMLDNYNLI
ncbi:MAG: WbqC family protein [Bacteroidales bacterium]|nr:WbqC family protein [Bacteroidales bacterium]